MNINGTQVKYAYALIHESFTNHSISATHTINLDEWQLHMSEDMDYLHIKDVADEIILLGYCLDIRNSQKSQKEILTALLNTNNIIDELDYINGRYAIIMSKSNTKEFYTDATSMLPTCYHNDYKIIASHDAIVAEILAPTQPLKPLHYGITLDFTRFEKVYRFNPSLSLNLDTYTFTRIYPRTTIQTKEIDEIINEMDPYIKEMNQWLSQQDKKMFMTITGGIDSRVSLSFIRELANKLEFITYIHPDRDNLVPAAKEIYDNDEIITKRIVDNFNLNHTKVELSEHPVTPEDAEYFHKYLQGRHSYQLVSYFKNYRKFHKALHIKSTIFEVGKAQFQLTSPQKMNTIEDMRRFLTNIPKTLKKRSDYDAIVEQYFERNLQTLESLKGRHYYDVNYVESRMANWHASTTQEVDPYAIEFVYVNNRHMIELLQSPPLQARKSRLLFRHLIYQHWPALLFHDINQDNYTIDKNQTSLSNTVYNELMISDVQNVDIQNIENHIEILPNTEVVGPHKVFTLNIENQSNDEKSIQLSSTYRKKSRHTFIEVMLYNSSERTPVSYDITDINEGLDITLQPYETLTIKLNYQRTFDKKSWRNAGRLILRTD